MRGTSFFAAAGLIAVICYLLLAQVEARVLATLFAIPCRADLVSVTCAYPTDGGHDRRAYLALAAGLALICGASFAFWRRTIAHPFLVTICALGLFAVCWDLAAGLPVIHGPKIINDTMNVLRFVILASFLLTFFMIRGPGTSLVRVTVAVVASFTVKLCALIAFASVQGLLMGATELFFLYVIYAFGAFTVHIMTVSGLIMGLDPPATEAAA
jgi:hypothetical protein